MWDCEQYIYALFTIDKVNYCGLGKKKKERKKEENVEEKRLNPNSHYIYISEGDKNRRMRPDGPNGSMSMGQKKVEPIP